MTMESNLPNQYSVDAIERKERLPVSLTDYVKSCLKIALRFTPPATDAATWWLAKFGLAFVLFVVHTLTYQAAGFFGTPSLCNAALFALATVAQILVGLPIYYTVLTAPRREAAKLLAVVAGIVSYAMATTDWTGLSTNLNSVDTSVSFTLSVQLLALFSFLFYLQSKYSATAAENCRYFKSLRVMDAIREYQGKITTVATDDLQIGDTIVVWPGERVPRDGVVLRGTTSVDESLLTGETCPLLKEPGEPIIGGSLNRDSEILVRIAQERPADVLEQMIRKTEATLANKSAIGARTGNGALAITLLLLLAGYGCFAFHFYFRHTPFSMAINYALAVLVAAPAGLGILSEIAFHSFVAATMRRGIILSRAQAVDTLARVKSIFFNKTGTLSVGNFVYSQSFIENGTNLGQFLTSVFSIEKNCSHPLAKAMATHPWFIEIPKHPVENTQVHPGLGVSATMCARGFPTFLAAAGNLRFMKRMRFHVSRDMKFRIDDLEEMGETIVLVGFEREVRGILSFSDTLRKDVRTTLRRLQKLGLETALITGDTEKTVTQLTGTLGIKKIHSRCTPEEKAAKILKEKENGQIVAIVDSDVDDNPALKVADVSLSIATGTNIANHPADVLLMGSDFTLLHWLIQKAKASHQALRVAEGGSVLLGGIVTAGACVGIITAPIAASVAFLWSALTLKMIARQI